MDDSQENEIFGELSKPLELFSSFQAHSTRLALSDSVKMRTKVTTSDETAADKAKNSKANSNNIEDELKWVEENVPSTITEA